MKILALVIALLGLWLANSGSLSAAEAPEEEVQAGTGQEIRITLNHRVPEGVIFSRRTVEGIPLFAISLFVNYVPYRTRLVTRREFRKHLAEFDRLFNAESLARSITSAPCTRHLRRTLEVNRVMRESQALCLSGMSRAGEEGLARWYQGVKALF